MSAIGAQDSGESGGEVSATIKLIYDIDCVGAYWAVYFAVPSFVVALEIVPGMVDDLPEW